MENSMAARNGVGLPSSESLPQAKGPKELKPYYNNMNTFNFSMVRRVPKNSGLPSISPPTPSLTQVRQNTQRYTFVDNTPTNTVFFFFFFYFYFFIFLIFFTMKAMSSTDSQTSKCSPLIPSIKHLRLYFKLLLLYFKIRIQLKRWVSSIHTSCK